MQTGERQKATGRKDLVIALLDHMRVKVFLSSYIGSFPGGSVVNNLPAMQETQVQSLGQEDPL